LHQLRFLTYGKALAGAHVDGHYRGFVNDDFIIVYYNGIGRTEVNSYFFIK
jgi:hypothetical protein